MPTRSKFNPKNRKTIIEALRLGLPRSHAAALAGVDRSQITRWVKRGEESTGDTPWRRFYLDVMAAEVSLPTRSLGVINANLEDRPDLAKWVVERRVPGYAPTPPTPAPPQGPVVIELSLNPGNLPAAAPLPANSIIEVMPPHGPTDPEDE